MAFKNTLLALLFVLAPATVSGIEAASPIEVVEPSQTLPEASKDVVTELILDASGSMKQKLGKRVKLYQAKRVLTGFMQQAQDDHMVLGLRVFGLKEKDCKDSKLLYKFGEKGVGAIGDAIEAIDPQGYGKTPLAHSLEEASKDLKSYRSKPRRIIVVSDGADTCGGDPCKVAKELKREHDIRIYVVGYALDAEARKQLKCLADATGGAYHDAENLSSLTDALKSLSDPGKNLFVKSPNPLGISELYEKSAEGKRKKTSEFVSGFGTRVEPGKEYEVRVKLDPPFVFEHVILAPKEKRTLVVKGDGTVRLSFFGQLFTVSLLNPQGKPVVTFASDTDAKVPAGTYRAKAVSPPFAETIIDDVMVTPGGHYEEKIEGFGAIQLDDEKGRPGPFGYYVFDDQKKQDLGSFLTGAPLVLPMSRYLIKTVGNAILRNVYPDGKEVRVVPIPPPGQTVTFARRETVEPNESGEPVGPKLLDQVEKPGK